MWLARQGWKVVAADASEHSLAACRLHAERQGVVDQIEFVHAAPPEFWRPLEGRQFELILAKDVIEHIQDDIGFVKAVKSCLAPQGSTVIVTQNDHSWALYRRASGEIMRNPN